MTVFWDDLIRAIGMYPGSFACIMSVIILLVYPFIVAGLKFYYRKKHSTDKPAGSDASVLNKRFVKNPWWLWFVPLPFMLLAVNFSQLFFWLPVTERGKTMMVKYLIYKGSFGSLIISSDFSRRLYTYFFSTGSQIFLGLIALLFIAWYVHEAVASRYASVRRLELDGYFFLYPAIVIIAIFHISPVFYSLVLSTHRASAMDMFKTFVFLDHYRDLMSDRTFWISLRNTAWFAVGSVPLTIGFSLFIAVLLNQKIRLLSFYRTIYFLPVITSVAAISLVWRWIYHPQRGVINMGLQFLGLGNSQNPINWLYDPRGVFALIVDWMASVTSCSEGVMGGVCYLPHHALVWIHSLMMSDPYGVLCGPSVAITAVVVMSVWKGLGYNIIIFLAGLQNIPKDLYDAARIDGAGAWSQFRNITWPLLSPTTYFVLIMSTISSFQVFAQIFMLYAGNATDGSRVVVYYLFEKGFQTFNFGYASALAYVLFLIIFTMTYVQRRFIGSKVHYD